METIGARIARLRKAQGLNQTQLGALVGVDQSTISDYENGSGFGADILMALAEALETTPETIMGGAPADIEAEASAVALLRKMDDDGRKAAIGSLRGIATTSPAKVGYTKQPKPEPPNKELKLVTKTKRRSRKKGT